MSDAELGNNNGNGKKALFESDRKLRTLVGNLPGVVYRCQNDKKWTMDFISKGCYDLAGYTQNQFYDSGGINWGDIIHEDDKEKIWKKTQNALNNDQQFHLNYRIRCADGKIKWISEHGTGVKSKNNEVTRLEGFIEDITQQKKAEEILKTRNRALNAAGKGIIISDAGLSRFPIIYVNEAFEAITGYKSHEVLGKNCDFLQSDDANQIEIDVIRSALREGKSCKVLLRNYKKDGTPFWNDLAITPVHDKNGKLTHFIGVQNDISDLVDKERQKDQKQQVLEMIIKDRPLAEIALKIVSILEEAIDDGIVSIWKLNNENNTLGVLSGPNFPKDLLDALDGITMNTKSCSCGIAGHLKKEVIVTNMLIDDSWEAYKDYLVGHSFKACWSFPLLTAQEEVLGVLSIYHKQAKAPSKEEDNLIKDATQLAGLSIEQHTIRRQLLHSQAQLEAYTQKLEKAVEYRTADLKSTIKKLKDSNSNLDSQIKETKIAEDRAEASEILFKLIAENFPKGAILLINDSMQIEYMEGTALENLKLQKQQQGTIKLDDLKNFSKRRKAIFKDYIKATLNGEHLSFDIKYRNRNYMINTNPIGESGKEINHALLVFNDITEQKLVEQDIIGALKKEQELNDLKSRFIATASHEFRTPLSIILSSANLIERQNTPDKAEVRLKHIKQIKSNVQNLVAILNDFLSISKLEEGAIKAKPEWFDLVEFSKAIVNEIAINKKVGQNFEIEYNDPELRVHLDIKLLRHILLNLLSNAVKYSKENQLIKLVIGHTPDWVSLAVIDYGIGIPLEEQKNLFQRFFRAKNSLDVQGTGLGLHIVKQYTELMGGKISFKSDTESGSTFRVDLPIKI